MRDKGCVTLCWCNEWRIVAATRRAVDVCGVARVGTNMHWCVRGSALVFGVCKGSGGARFVVQDTRVVASLLKVGRRNSVAEHA